MLIKTRLLLACAACVLTATPAFADSKFYVGIGGGVSQVLTSSRDLSRSLQARGHNVTASLDANEPGGEVYIGYKMLSELSLELSLASLGEFETRITGTTNNVAQLRRDAAELQPKGSEASPTLAIAARLPWTDDLSLLIRMGLFYWDQETEVITGSSTRIFKQDGIDPLVGLGLNYRVSSRWSIGSRLQGFFVDDNLLYLFTGNLEYNLP